MAYGRCEYTSLSLLQGLIAAGDAADVVARLAVGRDTAMAAHRFRSGVIGGKRQLQRPEIPQLLLQVSRPAKQIRVRLVELRRGQTEAARGAGHELHQPHRPLGRTRPAVAGRLLPDNRMQEQLINAGLLTNLTDQRLQMRMRGNRCRR